MAKRYITPKKLAEYMQIALEDPKYKETAWFMGPSNPYEGCLLVAAAIGRNTKRRRKELQYIPSWSSAYADFINMPVDIAKQMSNWHFGRGVSILTFINRLQQMVSWEQTDILFANP